MTNQENLELHKRFIKSKNLPRCFDNREIEIWVQSLDKNTETGIVVILAIHDDPDFPMVFFWNEKTEDFDVAQFNDHLINFPHDMAFWDENQRDLVMIDYGRKIYARIELNENLQAKIKGSEVEYTEAKMSPYLIKKINSRSMLKTRVFHAWAGVFDGYNPEKYFEECDEEDVPLNQFSEDLGVLYYDTDNSVKKHCLWEDAEVPHKFISGLKYASSTTENICNQISSEQINAFIMVEGEYRGFDDEPEEYVVLKGNGYNFEYLGMFECYDENE